MHLEFSNPSRLSQHTEMDKYKIVNLLRCWCIRISDKTRFDKLEQSIVHDEKFLWTIFSYVMTFLIFLNINTLRLPAVGVVVSFVFFLINSLFLGGAFFEDKEPFLRFAFGGLLLAATIGIVGWTILIIYNLDTIRSVIVLFIVGAISSIANRASRYTFSVEFVRDASRA
jgi:hypothetical protein